MKYILFPTLLLALVLTFCLFSALYVTHTVEQTNAYLGSAVSLYQAGDETAAAEQLKKAEAHWKDHNTYCGSVLKNEEIDHVTSEFASLRSYSRSIDSDDFLSNCAALQATLEHIGEMEWPYLQNIL